MNPVVRQHGNFAAGVVGSALPLFNKGFNRAVFGNGQRGHGDVDADTFAAARQVLHGKRVVDFAGFDIINGECGQIGGIRQFGDSGHGGFRCGGALWEVFAAKAVEQVLRQRAHAAGLPGELIGGNLQFGGGFGEGFVGGRLFVRIV